MSRLRRWVAGALVVAGSASLTYSLLAYRFSGEHNRRITAAVSSALPSTVASGGAGPADLAGPGERPPRDDRGLLHVPAPPEGQALGLLEIPSVGVHTAFFEGVSKSTLLVGPGHLPWTASPGTGGVSVISGHRDLHFTQLRDVRFGDRIFLQLPWASQIYRVDGLEVMTPDDELAPSSVRGTKLRLVTCWPPQFIGPAPDRLVVSATLARSKLTFESPRLSERSAARSAGALADETVIQPVAVVLPSAPDASFIELRPIVGAFGVAISALSAVVALGARRRLPWVVGLVAGCAVLISVLAMDLPP